MSFIPVHNSADCVESMINIAKVTMWLSIPYTSQHYIQVTCMPLRSVVRERFDYMLGKQLTEDTILSIIAQAGMTEHGTLIII